MSDVRDPETDQVAPIPNDRPFIQDLVVEDVEERKQHGIRKYGTALQSGNGRDMLLDAYEEALDLTVYLRGLLDEASRMPQPYSVNDRVDLTDVLMTMTDLDLDPEVSGLDADGHPVLAWIDGPFASTGMALARAAVHIKAGAQRVSWAELSYPITLLVPPLVRHALAEDGSAASR